MSISLSVSIAASCSALLSIASAIIAFESIIIPTAASAPAIINIILEAVEKDTSFSACSAVIKPPFSAACAFSSLPCAICSLFEALPSVLNFVVPCACAPAVYLNFVVGSAELLFAVVLSALSAAFFVVVLSVVVSFSSV